MGSHFGLLIYFTCLIMVLHFPNFVVSGKPQVPCYFIFGDSLFDTGNNNQLDTKWKANYPPYGIDFPKGHTGRFTNGRTAADIIGQNLGFDEFIPTYATATDDQISKGVNYASGGAGILDRTGIHNGDRFSFHQQIVHHNSTVSRISRIRKNTTFLKECIYVVNIGMNDYIHNYFSWIWSTGGTYNSSLLYSTQNYATILIIQYYRQLKALYNLGGRKVALFGLGQLGCTPFIVKNWGYKGKPCADIFSDAEYTFNYRLKTLVDGLNKLKPDARFTFINATSILQKKEGAPVTSPSLPIPTKKKKLPDYKKYQARPCCPVKDDSHCIPNSTPCPTRTSSTYFDSVHPTEPNNIAIATRSYKALLPTDVYPYDIHQLTQVKL
ncbi:putative triacylglycerol lipase [Helianthus annuus]|uniref:Putative SGNH hydrolase-type esterase domain-containing protein n=1 Tax=Helianthus annuus TaxID=4232 RepID=A0A251S2D5_HELAN|nr:putative triacylglycerol lipase [Helianthus annuus]KAJ0439025.1 putative triacylglycerol lipase [Helianthus annuus]KAJ0443987.1 putative triacylglycerol lipase [Helianthus annuus]KAJ0461384.1 putative triacylglycerol lipase [Helianthus annuus]KAJ0641809.1 putative triacylglycerol lipase [Helianthus annuus]